MQRLNRQLHGGGHLPIAPCPSRAVSAHSPGPPTCYPTRERGPMALWCVASGASLLKKLVCLAHRRIRPDLRAGHKLRWRTVDGPLNVPSSTVVRCSEGVETSERTSEVGVRFGACQNASIDRSGRRGRSANCGRVARRAAGSSESSTGWFTGAGVVLVSEKTMVVDRLWTCVVSNEIYLFRL